jgi:hypothetical protein
VRALHEYALKVPGYDGTSGMGADYAAQYHRLWLDRDDSNRLSNPAQIFKLMDEGSGVRITPKGVEALQKAMTESHKREDQAQINKSHDSQLKLMRDDLVLDQWFQGEKITQDLEGEKKYEQAVNAYESAFAKHLSDPKANPWDFLTDKKREEIMAPYKRTPRQMYSDVMGQGEGAQAKVLDPGQMIDQAVKNNPQVASGAVTRQDAEIEAAAALYKQRKLNLQQVRELNAARGWGFQLAPQAQPTARPEVLMSR